MSDSYGKIFGSEEAQLELIIETADSETRLEENQKTLMDNGEVIQ